MAEKFKSFYINHVPRQQNAHEHALVSLAASIALSIRATEKVLVQSRDLYCLKFALEDVKPPKGNLQIKKVLKNSTGPKPRDWRFSFIDFVLYDILPNDLKEAANGLVEAFNKTIEKLLKKLISKNQRD